MKKGSLILLLTFLLNTSFAQHLTSYNSDIAMIYNGRPKTLIEIEEKGVCITEFDEQGRIISEKLDKYDYTFRYQWTEDQLFMITCDDNDNMLSKFEFSYIKEPGHLLINLGKMGCLDFFFNENHTMNKMICSKNRQMWGFVVKYESDDPLLCTSIQNIVNGKETERIILCEYLEWDDKGNPIECIQHLDGEEYAIHRKITYYE